MWHVDSVSGTTPEGYTITRCQMATCKQCISEGSTCTATECNCLCIHMYKCDSKCYNFNNGHICKHIHRVHSILQLQDHQAESIEAEHTVQDLGQQQCEITENTEHPSLVYANSDADPQRGLYIAISIFTTSALLLDHSIQLQTFNILQKDLQSQINTNDNQIMPYLDHVNALLHQAVATCKAATQVFKLPEPLVKKENMPPGKSLDHQWRFVKTTKTPGRKKNGNVLRYSYYHRNQSSKIR